MACIHALSDVALSPEILAGRLIVLAPNCFDISIISSPSDETQTDEIACVFFACSIVYAKRGLPQKSIIFFDFMPLEPDRAGIIATIFFFASSFIFYSVN